MLIMRSSLNSRGLQPHCTYCSKILFLKSFGMKVVIVKKRNRKYAQPYYLKHNIKLPSGKYIWMLQMDMVNLCCSWESIRKGPNIKGAQFV